VKYLPGSAGGIRILVCRSPGLWYVLARQMRSNGRFQNPHEFRLHVLVVIGNSEHDHTPSSESGPKFLLKLALVNALHDEYEVGPLDEIRGNRSLRIRAGSRRDRFNPLIDGEDGFCSRATQLVPAAYKEELRRGVGTPLRQDLLPLPQLPGLVASAAGAAAGAGAGSAAGAAAGAGAGAG